MRSSASIRGGTRPQSTILFASIPNYGDALGQANQLFQQELQESAILREWWQAQQKQGAQAEMESAMGQPRRVACAECAIRRRGHCSP